MQRQVENKPEGHGECLAGHSQQPHNTNNSKNYTSRKFQMIICLGFRHLHQLQAQKCKPTDDKSPLYPLKSQWVTVNTWQIKDSNWQKSQSLLFRLSKTIWTYTLILRQENLYTYSGEQGRIEYTMSDILVPTLRNVHVYAHRVCRTMIT